VLRKLTVVITLAAGMSVAAAITLATPALAKGPSQAHITGPGLAHAIIVSGNGEPGQPGRLSTLTVQTRLFFVMFGWNATVPPQLRTPPPKASLGPRYTIIYTVPEQFGQIRQDLYPRAVGGPVIYTPQGQQKGQVPGFGWFRAGRHLPRTLAKLGISPPAATPAAAQARLAPAAHRAAAQQTGSRTLPWLIASAAAIAAAALAGTALWRRHRKSATVHDSE